MWLLSNDEASGLPKRLEAPTPFLSCFKSWGSPRIWYTLLMRSCSRVFSDKTSSVSWDGSMSAGEVDNQAELVNDWLVLVVVFRV